MRNHNPSVDICSDSVWPQTLTEITEVDTLTRSGLCFFIVFISQSIRPLIRGLHQDGHKFVESIWKKVSLKGLYNENLQGSAYATFPNHATWKVIKDAENV
jgi:hypothetical protein